MRWLETITLRCMETGEFDKTCEMLNQVIRDEKDHHLVSSRFYRGYEVDSDLTIHLLWNAKIPHPAKSVIGSKLAHLLNDFGLIHHTIWLEETTVDSVDQG